MDKNNLRRIKARFLAYNKKLFTLIDEIRFGRVRPALIVIGAQKSGTTALYRYLSMHPDLVQPDIKEIDYFNCKNSLNNTRDKYLKNFPVSNKFYTHTKSFDISPAYMLDSYEVAKAIKEYDSNIKLLALLREPVSRCFSAWHMYKKLCRNNRNWFLQAKWVTNGYERNINLVNRSPGFGENFENDINEEIKVLASGCRIEMPIVEYGYYRDQLRDFYNIFDHKNMLVIPSEEFGEQTVQVLTKIENFIDINHFEWEENNLHKYSVGDYEKTIPEKAGAILNKYYIEHNKGLQEMVGTRLGWLDNK